MRSLAIVLLLAAIGGFAVSDTSAAPYWGPDEVRAWLDRNAGREPIDATPILPKDRDRPILTYEEELARVAEFLRIWQVDVAGADFGGIREGEHLPNIIQTDNTSEAIWVWTRYYELTGDNQYAVNVARAFQYCMAHPAYLEEGGSLATTGYYRMYNCGWAVSAELKYRDVYGDLTFKTYGDSCASYLRYHTLNRFGSSFYDYVNPPVLAWAMGNLYYAGVHENKAIWRDTATAQLRDKVKLWVDGEPTLLANETWAMSGGATIWGMIEGYFPAYPDSTYPWLDRNKGQLDTYASPGDFTNAWNGWYALGHRSTGRAIADPYHLGLHIALTDTLMFEDGDQDGGVPAKPADTDQQDQTWVSNYLACFALSDILDPASGVAEMGAIEPRIELFPPAPNPFHPAVGISYRLAAPAEVRLRVFDAAGRLVRDLSPGGAAAGAHRVLWDGRDGAGREAAPGIYFLRMEADGAKVVRKAIRIR